MSTFIQTHRIRYGTWTYIYDRHIDLESSTRMFIHLSKLLDKLSKVSESYDLTIYTYQRRKKFISCKILDGERVHEAEFKTTLEDLEKDVDKITEEIIEDWSKLTKIQKCHYFEVK